MNIGGWDEQELVRRCKEGQEAAYAELVRRHRPRLFGLAYRLTTQRETAEDVVQETFIAAFRTMERFEPRPSLAAWLNTILIRAAGRAAERTEARAGTSLDAMLADADHLVLEHAEAGRIPTEHDPAVAAEAAELRAALSAAIGQLPFRYRAAVVTRFVLGMDYAEAAASLDTGLNTYKSHLLRGTRMLRQALAGQRAGEVQPEDLPPRVEKRPVAVERGSAPAGVLSAAGAGAGPSLGQEKRRR